MQLLIGTNNDGKFIEIEECLSVLPITLTKPQDLSIEESPEEHGVSFQENALIKAHFFREASGLPTVADDSGIEIDALKGELGIYTRRWGAGEQASDREWIEYFLRRMESEPNKRARFICHLAYIDDEGREHLFEGECGGTITETLEAEYLPGLQLAACFKPDGSDIVCSEMSLDQKNAISHRGRALEMFVEFLRSTLS